MGYVTFYRNISLRLKRIRGSVSHEKYIYFMFRFLKCYRRICSVASEHGQFYPDFAGATIARLALVKS